MEFLGFQVFQQKEVGKARPFLVDMMLYTPHWRCSPFFRIKSNERVSSLLGGV